MMNSVYQNYAYVFKFIIVGDSCVGKSCLLLQFIDRRFKPSHDLTIGVEFGSRTVSVQNKLIKLQIWDTAGQETFRSITRSYYRGSIGALLVYDIGKRQSFQSLTKWLAEMRENGHNQMCIILVGNKCDLEEREVSFQEGQMFAEKHNLLFMETSAKTPTNVDQAFLAPTAKICQGIAKNKYDLSSDVSQVNEHQNIGIKPGNAMPQIPVSQSRRLEVTSPGAKKEGKCCSA